MDPYFNNTEELSIAKYAVAVKFNKSFSSYKEIVEFSSSDELFSPNGSVPEIDPVYRDVINDSPMPSFTSAKKRTTALGGNDAVNCYYSFNEDDDIIPDACKIAEGVGLGRVYNELFDEQQQIMWMTFGIPQFADLTKFYKNLIDQNLAAVHNKGSYPLLKAIGTTAGVLAGTIAMAPIMPAIWLLNILGKTGDSPSRYYDIRPAMPLYYKMVNTLIAHTAANLGLVDESLKLAGGQGSPEIVRKYGLDILKILGKRSQYDKLTNISFDTDEEFDKLTGNKDEESIFSGFVKGLESGFTEAQSYVGFRIEKSDDNSESASNSTKESSISQFLNSKVSEGRERSFSFAGLKEGAIGAVISGITDAVGGFITGALSSVNMEGMSELLKGSGFIDIPEVWDNSSFTKSYNFNFQLRAPLGDNLSVFYSEYIPLFLIIGGAFPRAVGPNAYTSPLLVRAYSKGRFAIPMGIIDSISIKRGSAEFGWNINDLPTAIDVSITIKDLSPIMYVPLMDKTGWSDVFGTNTPIQEYLLTLSGTGLADRLLYWRKVRKKMNALLTLTMNNKLNPRMLGYTLANNTKVGRMITNFYPSSKLPNI
jgi:hypothetical protein